MANFITRIFIASIFILSESVFEIHSSSQEKHVPPPAIKDDNVTLPNPHIVILGGTGVGKSSLANVFIGESPQCTDCTFPICTDAGSCTKETTFAVRPWLGSGQSFTVVDTPGFGDTDQDDSVLIDEMMTVLKDTVKSANVLLLTLKGTETRLDAALQIMLREMKALFGEEMWSHVIVEVSFWSYAESSIDSRNRTCILTPEFCHDENWFKTSLMSEIEEKFHLGFELPFVFIDSWAKHPANINEPSQQIAFERETGKLWDLANQMQEFGFKSIQDVLEENQELKAKNVYLESILEGNITEILRLVTHNTEDITDLRILQGQASQRIDGHDDHLGAIESHLNIVDENLNSHTTTLENQNQRLGEHDQRFEETNTAIQGNSNLLADHQGQISNNGQLIDTLKNDFNNYQGVVDSNIVGLRNELVEVSSKSIRRCRLCFQASGKGTECTGTLSSCTAYAQWNQELGDWTSVYNDNTDEAHGGGCNMQWKLECHVGLE